MSEGYAAVPFARRPLACTRTKRNHRSRDNSFFRTARKIRRHVAKIWQEHRSVIQQPSDSGAPTANPVVLRSLLTSAPRWYAVTAVVVRRKCLFVCSGFQIGSESCPGSGACPMLCRFEGTTDCTFVYFNVPTFSRNRWYSFCF
jgi:hypothetical protein